MRNTRSVKILLAIALIACVLPATAQDVSDKQFLQHALQVEAFIDSQKLSDGA